MFVWNRVEYTYGKKGTRRIVKKLYLYPVTFFQISIARIIIIYIPNAEMNNASQISLAVATFLAAASILVVGYPSRPTFLGCTSSDDCGIDECCVLGTCLDTILTVGKTVIFLIVQ